VINYNSLSAVVSAGVQIIMYSGLLSLCLCNHICEQDISKSYEQILMKFFGVMGHGAGTNWLEFGDDPDSFVDPGSFSTILYH